MTAQCWVHVPRCAVGDAQGTGTLRRRRSLEKSVCGRESERVAAEPGGATERACSPRWERWNRLWHCLRSVKEGNEVICSVCQMGEILGNSLQGK